MHSTSIVHPYLSELIVAHKNLLARISFRELVSSKKCGRLSIIRSKTGYLSCEGTKVLEANDMMLQQKECV